MKTLITSILMLCFLTTTQARLVVELSIENQHVESNEFFFDIYLTRHADSHGDIYLADMDLVLNFNAQFFTSPILSTLDNDIDATGFCAFTPTTNTSQAEVDCRSEYFSKTATTTIIDNQLIINLLGPEPPDATTFDGLIAWVDGEPSVHRLGRFKITGINDQMGTAGLVWAETQTGTMTKVFSFENFVPWDGKPVEVETIEPADMGLDSMVSSTNEIWSNSFFIENIYPNPVQDELNLEINFSKNEDITFEVSDMMGRIILRREINAIIGENKFTFDISELKSGNYSISILNDNGRISKIFFKE